MKKMNYYRKIAAYLVIVSLSLSSLLFYSSGSIVFSAESVYSIVITSPESETILENTKAEFTGKISGTVPLPETQQLKVYEENAETLERVDITDTNSLSLNEAGEWTFSRVFSEGTHKVLFVLEDGSVKLAEAPINFTINSVPAESDGNKGSPAVGDVEEQPSDNTSLEENGETALPAIESSAERTDTIEATEVPVIRPQVTSIKIIASESEDSGFPAEAEDMTNVPINASIQISIKENGELIVPGEPILVFPEMKTESLKSVETAENATLISKDGVYVLTFTPLEPLQYKTTYYVYINPAISNKDGGRIYSRYFKFTTTSQNTAHDLHGNYANNTNSCGACHSTHTGQNEKLLGGKYGSDPGKDLCMACHDGTTAPAPDKENTKHKHTAFTDKESSNSCASCHNPHGAWTPENPGKIKLADPDENLYATNSYLKQGKAIGTPEDFSLCFQCHNGDAKKSKAVDIEKYYKDKTTVAQSGHNITAVDGSKLKGQLTCADCHETHGSNNIFLLKENLGNKPLMGSDKFTSGEHKNWNAYVERDFCLKCHSAKTADFAKTELYGKTPLFNPTSGNHRSKTLSCSECHGVGDDEVEQLRSTAHAPKKLTNPVLPTITKP